MSNDFQDFIKDLIKRQLGITVDPERKWVVAPLIINRPLNDDYFDTLNNDKHYKKRTVRVFYHTLIDEWLYNKPIFLELLPYFTVTEHNKEITISPVSSLQKLDFSQKTEKERYLVNLYIEANYINEKMVKEVLKEFKNVHHLKWYDLYTNKKLIMRYLFEAIKQIIIETINMGMIKK